MQASRLQAPQGRPAHGVHDGQGQVVDSPGWRQE
jgi:hypothetical protein